MNIIGCQVNLQVKNLEFISNNLIAFSNLYLSILDNKINK